MQEAKLKGVSKQDLKYDYDDKYEEIIDSPKLFTKDDIILQEDFQYFMLDSGSTTKVTTLNRVNSFYFIIFAGNFNGCIAYGKGRSHDTETALIKAYKDLKKNLIQIPMDPAVSLVKPLDYKYMNFRLKVWPKKNLVPKGHPTILFMLFSAGFDCFQFKVLYPNMNFKTMLMAFFKVMTSNETPKMYAERNGAKVYRQRLVNPFQKKFPYYGSFGLNI